MAISEEYLLGRTSDEYQRLERQALLWQPLAIRMLKETGIKEGMKCLDVGCGTGSVMRLMGAMVGRKGSVTGIDINEKIGNESLNILRAIGDCQYYFEAKDITKPGAFEPEAYDFIYTRFVLLHQTDPASVIRNLFAALKPGGMLLVQDYDIISVKSNDKTKEITEHIRFLLKEVFTRTGKDPEVGMHLSSYFIKAGVGLPDGTDVSSIVTPAPLFMAMIKAVAFSMKAGIIALQLSTAEEFDDYIQKTDEKATELQNYYYTWPLVHSAWKCKN